MSPLAAGKFTWRTSADLKIDCNTLFSFGRKVLCNTPV